MIRHGLLDPRSAPVRVELAALWNRSIGGAFPLDARLLDQQLDMERDELRLVGARETPEGAAEGDGLLVGAALAKRAARPGPGGTVPALGHLSFLVVDPAFARRGIGGILLAACEDWLVARGARELRLGGDRCHFFPGAPADGSPGSSALRALLEDRGWRPEGLEHDLAADLGTLDLAALRAVSPIAPGYAFGFYSPGILPALDAFFRANFPGRWRDDTLEALEAGMRDRDLCLLTEEATGRVVGFARIYDPGSPILGPGTYWRALMGGAPGGLGPIGVDDGKRGLGLGLGLLRASLEVLASRGVRFMSIDWTDLPDFYAKMGFSIWRSYRLYSKEAPGRAPGGRR